MGLGGGYAGQDPAVGLECQSKAFRLGSVGHGEPSQGLTFIQITVL